MAEQAAPSESASPDKVVERLGARRDQVQKYIVKFRFSWLSLSIACLIGMGANAAIDVISGGELSPANWYQGALAGAVLYLVLLGLIHASLRGDLIQTNRILAATDTNLRTSTVPPLPRHGRKPLPETWKDQPLAVATVAIVGTLIVMFTAVIPTWLKEKDNEIATLKTEPTRLKTELDDLNGQLRRMESENLKLRTDLDRLSPDSLFSLDDVYPKGFRAVRIGDRVDLLNKVYGAEADFEEEEVLHWITITFRNPHLFSSITYYYDQTGKLKTVTHILFHFDDRDGQTFNALKQQLIDKYSQSKMKEIKTWGHKTEVEWSGIHKHTVQLGNGLLHISRSE